MQDLQNIYTISRVRSNNTCPRQHYNRYVLGLAPKAVDPTLERGTIMHERLANVYTQVDRTSNLAKWHYRYDDLFACYEDVVGNNPLVELPLIWDNAGGVTDLIAYNVKSNLTWVVDHKSVEKFYPYPEIYSAEQLGLYLYLVYSNCPEFTGQISGGCINRILYKENVKYQYSIQYILRQLKYQEDITLNKTLLNKLQQELVVPVHNRKGSKVWKFSKNHVRPRKLTITIRDELGQLTRNMTYIGGEDSGDLIHIERIYIPISQERLHELNREFVASMTHARQKHTYRTPGLHCSQCPFNVMCPAEQKIGAKPGTLVDDSLEFRPANEELQAALDRHGKK